MRILVTNDDGIDSTGLHVLAQHLEPVGEVVVVAPDREYSGFGAAVGTLHDIRPEMHRSSIDGLEEVWVVTGPPALCVLFARMGAFGHVDMVVSGVNPGENTGRAIYHSGTVGAALTARNAGIPGIAVSQSISGFAVEGQGFTEALKNQIWDSAAQVAASAAQALLADLPSTPIVVNLNVPNLPIDEIEGWRYAQVGTVPPRSVSSVKLVPKLGHEDVFQLEMEWGDPVELPEDTDGGAVERNQVAVTYLTAFAHQDRDDVDGIGVGLDKLLT